MANNWGNIPLDIAEKIAKHLEMHEDLQAFAAVCSLWRSAVKQANLLCGKLDTNPSIWRPLLVHDHYHKIPWLMLPTREDDNGLLTRRRFHNICFKHKVHNLDLPPPAPADTDIQRRKMLSSRGWLLLCSVDGKDPNLLLFNPFSGVEIKVPWIPKSPCTLSPGTNIVYHKFVLSADPTTTFDYVIALIYSDFGLSEFNVAIWCSTGHRREWITPIRYSIFSRHFCNDICFYHGELYDIDSYGQVLAFGSGKAATTPRCVAQLPDAQLLFNQSSNGPLNYWYSLFHLVECDDRLLVLYRFMSDQNPIICEDTDAPGMMPEYQIRSLGGWGVSTQLFRAFEVNFETGGVDEVFSLGNRSIFVGVNSSFSLEPIPGHGCKPNSIYYTDGHLPLHDVWYTLWAGDIGVFNFTDRKIETFYDEKSCFGTFALPATWVESPV